MTDASSGRFVALIVVSSVAFFGPAQGAINPVPVLAIRLDQAAATVYTNASSPGIITFNGTCTVDKLPIERATVTLSSSTDVGWATQLSPTTMVFTSTTPQSFTCTVVVPQGTPNMTGTLVLNGRVVAGGLQSTSETKAVINNIGPPPYVPPANGTGNGTAPAGGPVDQAANITGGNVTSGVANPGRGFLGLPNDLWMAAAAAILVVGIAGYGASRARAGRVRREHPGRP